MFDAKTVLDIIDEAKDRLRAADSEVEIREFGFIIRSLHNLEPESDGDVARTIVAIDKLLNERAAAFYSFTSTSDDDQMAIDVCVSFCKWVNKAYGQDSDVRAPLGSQGVQGWQDQR